MPAPQSPSVVHDAATQKLSVVGAPASMAEVPASTAGKAGSVTAHGASMGQGAFAGSGVATGVVMHVNPFPQSVSPQVAARARGAAAIAMVKHPKARVSRLGFENDMSAPIVK